MPKPVMKRVFELISEQDPQIQEFLREVLRIERAHPPNADSGIKDKIRNELAKHTGDASVKPQ